MRSLFSTRSRPPALHRQDGISMIITIAIMFVTSLMLVGAFTATQGEIRVTGLDTDAKKAYYAAEAGVNDYLQHLTEDSNYLSYCTSPTPANPALNQEGEEPLNKATIPGTEGEATPEKYAIVLLTRAGSPEKKCNRNNLIETMIEQTGAGAGSFRIKSIGYAGPEKREIIATFKNVNFVSFVWFTTYETFDPVVYGTPYKTECAAFYTKRPNQCNQNNSVVTGETIDGPMHTEDSVSACGTPVFGSEASQHIEFASRGEQTWEGGRGYGTEGLCGSSNPTFVGTHIPAKLVPELEPPPGDEELQHIVESGYEFKNKTEIKLEGTEMSVTAEGKTEKKKLPKNHLIYVSGGGTTYSPFGPSPSYTGDSAYGNVYVKGKYEESLTIAAQNDVIIDGNIEGPHNTTTGVPEGTAMLGLIANNFVRIYHPVSGCNNTGEDLKEPTVYAAMLALKQSIMVDNFNCGEANLGTLNVWGAIAGLFSNGSTGIFGEQGGKVVIEHGYAYNLKYDRRLQAEEPPHFLNPIRAAWQIQRETLASNP
ncbi:MAG: hypothetical protein ACLQBY_00620 [Solirubrobacteraceae bacterium]